MGVDSRLFVVCNKEDVLGIGDSVVEALNKYSRDVLDEYWKNNTDADYRLHFLLSPKYKDDSVKFSNGVHISSYGFDAFSIIFGSGDEYKRDLFLVPDVSDYDYICDGYKVSFSIGMWGKSEEIMMVVAEAVKPFGDVYYDFNDCDDKDFVKLN